MGIQTSMRRSAAMISDTQVVRAGDLEIDFNTRRVSLRGNAVRLTPKEFDLLQFLASNANKPVPHRKLLQTVWGPDYGDEVEYLRVFINSLRKKIEVQPSKPQYLVTEPWVGYRFVIPETATTS
jgi:two-component system, OmpR family, KDP operon response regulator KdpE